MEAFGVIGMSMGTMGFIFGIIGMSSMSQVAQLRKDHDALYDRLRRAGVLRE